MLKILKNHNAQLIGEYSLTIVIVLGFIAGMTFIMKRSLQGRLIDTEESMGRIIKDYSYTDASGDTFVYPDTEPMYAEYEPYYANRASVIDLRDHNERRLTTSGPLLSSGVYREDLDQRIGIQTGATQAPPKDAD
ncbi:MAG: hypothetical protein A2787_05500 [Omnitrophica WOR_2 bacterium RIFCSPHIGHO2_01_FULL_48_9]|nr:MAG: hypothetical protein A3D10_06245 [Omnitrophica WOR_2 bacterium RIFCSPHIGHO2_02_FULL_48_11]OGX32834.1 MAG: hypothetical protein A2787_05500 [Omnitrophica WOR_2 bacterium RIFCSPHIGHO2_01_FULL_48_9]